MTPYSLRRGFTLIELLVVIAIIAVLAAILFPVLTKARERAMQAACANNQRQIAMSILMYAQDHNQVLPEAGTVWQDLILTPKILVCPSRKPGANSYIYCVTASGQSVGYFPDPTAILLTSDGQHTATSDTNAPVYQPTVSNVGYADGDLAKRHNLKYLGSYLDGHVALGDASPLWLAPVPPGGVTADLLQNMNDGAVINGRSGWTRNPMINPDAVITYNAANNAIVLAQSATGLNTMATRALPFAGDTGWEIRGTYNLTANPNPCGSESNPDSVLRVMMLDGTEAACIAYRVINTDGWKGYLTVNDRVVRKDPLSKGWQEYQTPITIIYVNGVVTTTVNGVSSTRSCAGMPVKLVATIRDNVANGLIFSLSNLVYDVKP